jgi:hypothetical protein
MNPTRSSGGDSVLNSPLQSGGSNVRETVRLPELLLQVGGLETRLRPARIYAKPTGDETHHGLLGMDVLSQAREVRIDFSRMRLDLFQ